MSDKFYTQRILVVAILVTTAGCATSQKLSYTKNGTQSAKIRDSTSCELAAEQIQSPDWTAGVTILERWSAKDRKSKAYDLCMRSKGYALQAIKLRTQEESKAASCSSASKLAGQMFKMQKTVSREDAEKQILAANAGKADNHPGIVQVKYALKQGYEAKTESSAMADTYEKCMSTFDLLVDSYVEGLPISDITN